MARLKTTTSKSHRRKTSGTKMRSTNVGMSNNRLSLNQRGCNTNHVKVSDLEKQTPPQESYTKFASRGGGSEPSSINKITTLVRGMRARLQVRKAKEARRQARDANESHAQKHQRMLRYIFGEEGMRPFFSLVHFRTRSG